MVGWDAITNPYRGCDLSDPNHGWNAGRAQRAEQVEELAVETYCGCDTPGYTCEARCYPQRVTEVALA